MKKVDDKHWVTFKYHAPPGSNVWVAGTFNDWNPAGIRLAYENGVHSAALLLAKGAYEYKFVVDGEWRHDPNGKAYVPNAFGTLNSVLTVGRAKAGKAHPHTFQSRPSVSKNGPMWTAR